MKDLFTELDRLYTKVKAYPVGSKAYEVYNQCIKQIEDMVRRG